MMSLCNAFCRIDILCEIGTSVGVQNGNLELDTVSAQQIGQIDAE